jgi:hypothetical protein
MYTIARSRRQRVAQEDNRPNEKDNCIIEKSNFLIQKDSDSVRSVGEFVQQFGLCRENCYHLDLCDVTLMPFIICCRLHDRWLICDKINEKQIAGAAAVFFNDSIVFFIEVFVFLSDALSSRPGNGVYMRPRFHFYL